MSRQKKLLLSFFGLDQQQQLAWLTIAATDKRWFPEVCIAAARGSWVMRNEKPRQRGVYSCTPRLCDDSFCKSVRWKRIFRFSLCIRSTLSLNRKLCVRDADAFRARTWVDMACYISSFYYQNFTFFMRWCGSCAISDSVSSTSYINWAIWSVESGFV